MKHKKSDWLEGLLHAEEMSKKGWRVGRLDYVGGWFEWEMNGSVCTVFGSSEWLDGARDYYKNKNGKVNVMFEYQGKQLEGWGRNV